MHEVGRLPDVTPDPRDDGTLPEGLLDGLLSDVLPEPPGSLDAVPRAIEAHREHARAWYGDLIGPLSVPASAVPAFVDGLRPGDHALPMVLVGPWQDAPDELMRAARAQLLDDDRIELAGVELSLPGALAPAVAAEQVLASLDASVPSWLRVPAHPAWIEALDVIAEDGAERVAVVLADLTDLAELSRLSGPAAADASHRAVAAMIQSLASRGVRFGVTFPPGTEGAARPGGLDLVTSASSYGLLNLLVAISWAAEAAAVADLSAIGDNVARMARLAGLLAETDSKVVIDAARRIGPQSTAAIRRLLDRVACTSVRALISDLEAAGLIVPDVA